MVYKKKITKSKAGVEYVHFVPTLEGTPLKGSNRLERRKHAAFERSVVYRKEMARINRKSSQKADKAHESVVETAKKKLDGKKK